MANKPETGLPKKSRVQLQSLPPTPNGLAKARITPTVKSVEANYPPEDVPAISAAMADSLGYGLASLSSSPAPRDATDLTERMLARYVGRCLWTWADVPNLNKDHLQHLLNAALRPTTLFPEDMQAISPRLACNLLQGSLKSIERVIGSIGPTISPYLNEGIPNYSLASALALTCYGELQDRGLTPYYRLTPLAKRAGYSVRQSLILNLTERSTLPFASTIMCRTLYEDDLAARLRESEPMVVSRLAELGAELGLEWPDAELPHMLQEGPIPYAAACEKVVKATWDFPLGDVGEGDPDDELLMLTCRMIVAVLTSQGRLPKLPAPVLFTLSALTGISPAAFVRYAILDVARRGTTYLTTDTVTELAHIVEDLTGGMVGKDAGRADVLVRELRQLEGELDRTELRHENRMQSTGHLTRCRDFRIAPEWGFGLRAL